ncbi:protein MICRORCHIDIA 7 isoform X1 [Physcomitrium patens]|uniref:protein MICRORCHIDIA 7 isoform X1 n=2 Tax=Physcomitrium patens TaxID=3218 RepID=UPI000D16BD1B|nr:protein MICRORCHIDIA 7-like isoform X1 [Physcomitrium patens]|eukprot:XP_024385499.1 protein MICRORCHIDIA 7-like isoform X1 [Physcomitrella patens]
MGTQPALEGVKQEPAAGNEGMAMSLDHSSTTVSDGGSPQQLNGTKTNSVYVSQLKACILQKRYKAEPTDTASTELEDAESPSGAQWSHDHGTTVLNPVQTPSVTKQPNPAPFFNWPPSNRVPSLEVEATKNVRTPCRQFWKAGDYEGVPTITTHQSGGIDHVRVHPKFLHSNATSHKWALGAIAEILDNSMDEVKNGATFVNVDMIRNPRDGSPMLYIEDNGGGMTPERMRECMSLGFSTKSKSGNTIGQYGNGFKTSTMRLGADVIVFSRSPADAGRRATQSIGVLSFTFLRSTGHDDIVVPMVDYELKDGMICPLIRSTAKDWAHNLRTIQQWSPYCTEHDLFTQFFGMTEKGTKVIIYNLWEDEHGRVELDFESDRHDIQVRSEDLDERKIAMAQRYTYSRHYLTYQHSLRSYASILYYRHPPGFRIILRGQDVPHHNLADDLMYTQELSYKPQGFESSRDVKMVATVVMGFIKDAKEHVDVQGFSVYHKNRLIKPFWRVWNTAGSDGRGIVGVLEANFVEPAHDKQSFERTAVLSRLELRLLQMQKLYWANNCHLVGYVNKKLNRRNSRQVASEAEFRTSVVQVEGHPYGNLDTLLEGPRSSTPGFPLNMPVNMPRVDVASPPIDMGFHLVYRNRSSSKPGPPGLDLSYEVDRSGSGTPEVSTPYKNFIWQASESESRESPGDGRGREDLVSGFETLQMVRRGAADPATLHGLLTNVNGQGQPFDMEITRELEENKQLRDRVRKLEQAEERSLHIEIDRNRKLEAQLLDMEQQEAVDRRCLEQYTRERDNLRAALAEERRLHEHDDEDMRKNLKVSLLRARELEAENNRLRLLHS